MEKDFDLEQIFDAYQPSLGDSNEFIAALERRMAAVEYIREMQQAERTHYRRALALSLVLGIVLGGTLMTLLLLTPHDTPVLSCILPSLSILLSPMSSQLISTLLVSLLLGALVITLSHLMVVERTSSRRDAALCDDRCSAVHRSSHA